MADEVKNENVESKPEAAPKATEAVGAGEASKATETPKEAPAKKVRPANCEGCNKSIKVKWYYRNGSYYCTKQCFKTTEKKKKAKEAQSAEPKA